jgi:copper homeostasis protein
LGHRFSNVIQASNCEIEDRLMGAIILEVCVDTVDDANAAREAGAGRVELCSCLELGGLTPSFGLVKNAIHSGIPLFVMIRPRAGDFVYSRTELDCMAGDIECLREVGVSGFVFGALDSSNNLDEPALEKLIAACSGLPAILNRAIDLSADPIKSLEVAMQLGFERVLTSGAATSAVNGLAMLTKFFAIAEDQIIIVPGGCVTPETIDELLAALPVLEIHASCKKPLVIDREAGVDVNVGRIDEQVRYQTDPEAVSNLVDILNSQ